jgi:hypothetical protein
MDIHSETDRLEVFGFKGGHMLSRRWNSYRTTAERRPSAAGTTTGNWPAAAAAEAQRSFQKALQRPNMESKRSTRGNSTDEFHKKHELIVRIYEVEREACQLRAQLRAMEHTPD